MNILDDAILGMWEQRMDLWELYDKSKYDVNGVSKITQLECLYHYHLIAMRCYKGYDRWQMSDWCEVPFVVLEHYETTRDIPIPKNMEEIYLLSLGITKSDFKKILQILAGERTMEEENDRQVPLSIKTKVRKRDGNKCTACGNEEHLHFHHIKRFSKGGLHTVDNIKLLCVTCHEIEHLGEQGHGMLRAQKEKLLGVIA